MSRFRGYGGDEGACTAGAKSLVRCVGLRERCLRSMASRLRTETLRVQAHTQACFAGMFTGMNRNVHRHVCRYAYMHAYMHVCRHVCRHVSRHVYSNVYRDVHRHVHRHVCIFVSYVCFYNSRTAEVGTHTTARTFPENSGSGALVHGRLKRRP